MSGPQKKLEDEIAKLTSKMQALNFVRPVLFKKGNTAGVDDIDATLLETSTTLSRLESQLDEMKREAEEDAKDTARQRLEYEKEKAAEEKRAMELVRLNVLMKVVRETRAEYPDESNTVLTSDLVAAEKEKAAIALKASEPAVVPTESIFDTEEERAARDDQALVDVSEDENGQVHIKRRPLMKDVPLLRQNLETLSLRAFESIPGFFSAIFLFNEFSIDSDEFKTRIAQYDILDIIRFCSMMAKMLKCQSEIMEYLSAKHIAVDIGSRIVNVTDRIYDFEDSKQIDLFGVRVQHGHCHPIAFELWPSIMTCSRSVVRCARDPREVVRAFYSRAIDVHADKKFDILPLFTNKMVRWVNDILDNNSVPWTDVSCIEHVALRIQFFFTTLPRAKELDVPLFLVSEKTQLIKVPKDLFRFAAVLILGYGITHVVDEMLPRSNPLSGWQQRDSATDDDDTVGYELGGHQPDAFETDVFTPQLIRRCRRRENRPRDAYYDNTFHHMTHNPSNSKYKEQLDRVTPWTQFASLLKIHPMVLRQTMQTLDNRCVALSRVVITSPHIDHVPFFMHTVCLKTAITMDQCPGLLLGFVDIDTREETRRVITGPCPLRYCMSARNSVITGSKIIANAVTIIDLDSECDAMETPFYIKERTVRKVSQGSYACQIIVGNLIPDEVSRDPQNFLVTYYTAVHHLRNVVTPCDMSVLHDTDWVTHISAAALDQRMKATDSTGTSKEWRLQTAMQEAERKYRDGKMKCGVCAARLAKIVGGGFTADAVGVIFPYCLRTCVKIEKVKQRQKQETCSSRPSGPCSSCCGNYKSITPRIIITVDPRESASVVRLLELVALMRAMICRVLIIVRPPIVIGPSPDGVEEGIVNELLMIVGHLADRDNFSRVEITVSSYAAPAEARALNVISDFIHVCGYYGENSGAPQWHEMISNINDELHSFLLSLLLRAREKSLLYVAQLADIVTVVQDAWQIRHRHTSMIADGVKLWSNVRAILIYFDRIGLIKYCSTIDAVHVSCAAFIKTTSQMGVPESSDIPQGAMLENTQRIFETNVCGKGQDIISLFKEIILNDRSLHSVRVIDSVAADTNAQMLSMVTMGDVRAPVLGSHASSSSSSSSSSSGLGMQASRPSAPLFDAPVNREMAEVERPRAANVRGRDTKQSLIPFEFTPIEPNIVLGDDDDKDDDDKDDDKDDDDKDDDEARMS
jgi:hypothetical protein